MRESGCDPGRRSAAPWCSAVRYSIAKCTPASLRPSTGRSRGCVAPVQSTSASKSLRSSCASTLSPTCALQMNLMPSRSIIFRRRSTTSRLSSFMFGMPYISRPPGRSARSSTVTLWPARLSCAAAASPAGPEPITATFLPVRCFGGSGTTQPSSQPLIDDRVLDGLDRHRRSVDAEHARAFARRRADAAGELREVVGHVQALERLAPQPAIHQVVPFRDQVVDGTARRHAADQLAGVAERHAAVHAARGLVAQPPLFHVVMEFVPVAHALLRRAVDRQLAQVFDETGGLAHQLPPTRARSLAFSSNATMIASSPARPCSCARLMHSSMRW